MIRKLVFGCFGLVAVVALVFGGWLVLYPSPTDPKNLVYVLWKNDLHDMAIPDAAAAMIGDPHRDDLVVGKSRNDLERRFGRLLALSETPACIRRCYHEYGEEPGHKPLFIADSDWMIIFTGDRAIRLVNMKSCY